MKIIQIVTEFLPAMGGVERHVYEISKRLVERGHQVTILTSNLLKERPFTKFSTKPRVSMDGVDVRRFNAYQVLPLRAGIVMPDMIGKLLKVEADIVHAHGYGRYPVMVASIICKSVRKTPLIITTHAIESPFGLPKLIKVGYNLVVGLHTLKSADRIIAITRTEAFFLSGLGVAPEKISVIPNGIDLQLFFSFKDSAPPFLEGNDTPYILFVGRIDEHKGLKYLVKAFPQVLREYPDMKLILVGEDWGSKDELNRIATSVGIQKQIIFTGKISQEYLLKAYSHAKLFVLPSLVEAFGIVLLEAMAFCLPVVATRVGGIPDVIKHGRNGFLVKPMDLKQLSNTILRLLRDQNLRESIARQNKEDVKRYDWNCIVEEIESCYEELI